MFIIIEIKTQKIQQTTMIFFKKNKKKNWKVSHIIFLYIHIFINLDQISQSNNNLNMKTKPLIEDFKDFSRIDINWLLFLCPSSSTSFYFPEKINRSIVYAKPFSEITVFSLLFGKEVIKDIGKIKSKSTTAKSTFSIQLSHMQLFIAKILIKDGLLCKSMTAIKFKAQLLQLFKKLSSSKLKKNMKNIKKKIEDISLKNVSVFAEKIKLVANDVNFRFSEIYNSSSNLFITERCFSFFKKKLRILLLIDQNTNFVIKIALKFNEDFDNQDIIALIGTMNLKKKFSISFDKKFSNLELFSILREKGIIAFGILKTDHLKRECPLEYEILENQKGAIICCLKENNILTNLTGKEIMGLLKNTQNPSEKDVFSFFQEKFESMKFKRKTEEKISLKNFYEKAIQFIIKICLKNTCILMNLLSEKKDHNVNDVQMKLIESYIENQI